MSLARPRTLWLLNRSERGQLRIPLPSHLVYYLAPTLPPWGAFLCSTLLSSRADFCLRPPPHPPQSNMHSIEVGKCTCIRANVQNDILRSNVSRYISRSRSLSSPALHHLSECACMCVCCVCFFASAHACTSIHIYSHIHTHISSDKSPKIHLCTWKSVCHEWHTHAQCVTYSL